MVSSVDHNDHSVELFFHPLSPLLSTNVVGNKTSCKNCTCIIIKHKEIYFV